ncbi:hypothetical protein IL306_001918 [Fusarium sp. DS 682]|nr:hypothetical protein IL306_001918 [Fusarium sp. DS 682]
MSSMDNSEEFTKNGDRVDREDYTWACGVGTVKLKTKRFVTKSRSQFHPEIRYDIQAKWPVEERQRFELYESTRDPAVIIGEKPWTDEEKAWLKKEGVDFDKEFEEFKKEMIKEQPEAAEDVDTDTPLKALRAKYRVEMLKNPFQDRFDMREAEGCDFAFSEATLGFISEPWGDALGFMKLYGYRYDVDDRRGGILL